MIQWSTDNSHAMTAATAYEQAIAEQKAAELRYSKAQYEKLRQSDPRHPALGWMADALRRMEEPLSAELPE